MSYGLSGQVILANFTNSAYFLHHTGSVVISYWLTLHCPYFFDMRNTRGGSLVFGGRQFQRAFFFSFPKLTLSLAVIGLQLLLNKLSCHSILVVIHPDKFVTIPK